jgi:DNA modification methylase
MILKEYQLLKPLFQVGKGTRTDIIGKESKLDVKETLGVSKNTIQRICNIDKFAKELFGSENSEDYKRIWQKIDSGETNITKTEKRLRNQVEVKQSLSEFPQGDYSSSDFVIYHSNSKSLIELEDDSIQTIITSPPYFHVKDYNIGKKQLGKESEPYEFTVNLAEHFDDCYRVLNSKGSLFVNLGDYIVNGEYKLIPAHFGLEMSKRGWKINDVIIWAKNNPRPSLAKRTICSTEYIIHFVKSTHFYYNLDWVKELGVQDKSSSLKTLFNGFDGNNAQLRSFLDFRGDNIIKSNAANTHKLREKCKELGVSIIHDSTFPEILPEIFIRTTSVEGQIILDVFNGTATVGAVAKVLKRKYVGYELNPEYIFQSKVRVENLLEDTRHKLLKSA